MGASADLPRASDATRYLLNCGEPRREIKLKPAAGDQLTHVISMAGQVLAGATESLLLVPRRLKPSENPPHDDMSAAAAPRSLLAESPDLHLPKRSPNPKRIAPLNRPNPPESPAPPQRPAPARRRRPPPLESVAYERLLRCASRGPSLALVRIAHSHMLRTGYRPGLFLCNNLLAAYCRCRDMRHGRLLFDGMPRRDVVSWNTLIAGYSSSGSPLLALGASRDAWSSGVCADRYTYAAVLGACASARDGRSGRAAHGLAVVSGHACTAFVTNSVMDMYAKCGMIDEVRLVFDRAEERDEVSWNLLLSAYVRMGWPEVAVNVLVWMHRSGAKLDAFALGGIVKACSELEDSDDDVRKMLHGCVVKVGLDLNVFVGSAMVDMYAKNGGLEEAIKVFDCIPDQNVVVYNAMIAGFARLGNDPCPEIRIEAVRIYSNLLQRRMRPSKFTFKSLLEVCNLINAVRCGRQIHTHVIISGFEGDEYIANALINLYSKVRAVGDSLRCFHRTPKQEIFTWTSMITAFMQDGHFEKALDLFGELRCMEIEPDQFTISIVMNSCAALSMPMICEQMHCYVAKSGFDQFTVCGNSQIEMYRNIGDLKAAKKTFEKITCLDTFSWSQMVLSYAVHGHGREALLLFETMKDRGVMINEFAFLAILVACSHQGLTDEGSRIHGDKERGIKIGEKLMAIEPFAASSYVMLYNLYMDAGKISFAMRTRGLMR
ncbi:hypothetical protein PR202_gb10307 [Eleusine coracana subsp. coracana]|uniref:Pentatricopeptide repeat-containing protein n=1 Tax=Eleusine coracana subsp. coracana TaxID=191504 RepID=A0AAV5EIW3_ELECO|nr:hypothetical protein PR202_gb10307 [Eleusine coracana subsp. coracana]